MTRSETSAIVLAIAFSAEASSGAGRRNSALGVYYSRPSREGGAGRRGLANLHGLASKGKETRELYSPRVPVHPGRPARGVCRLALRDPRWSD